MRMMAPPTAKPQPTRPFVPVLQRKCDCGAPSLGSGPCATCAAKEDGLQRKLVVGAGNDPLEQEADRVADQIVAAPARAGLAAAPLGVQRFAPSTAGAAQAVPPSVDRVLATPGRPLQADIREDMEGHFGRDFSQVRIHQGQDAERSARDVGARAYTVGGDVVFGAERFSPATTQGRRLLAHELAHVVQQGRSGPAGARSQSLSSSSHVLQRQPDGIIDGIKNFGKKTVEEVEKTAEKYGKAYLEYLANKPGPGPVYVNPDTDCPPTFCNPFMNKIDAAADLLVAAPMLLAGIKKYVSPRALPFWTDYLTGGASLKDITASYWPDFAMSETTKETTEFLYEVLKEDIAQRAKALMGSAPAKRVVFGTARSTNSPKLNAAFSAIMNQDSGNPMDFAYPKEVAGNIAGGIGKDQATTTGIGAKPSRYNDMRIADISCDMFRKPASLLVAPSIWFKVTDTVDLCPGNCGDGSKGERVATIPLSRFEATGLTGDVPFRVEFPGRADFAPPFEIALPADMPAVEKVKPTESKPTESNKVKADPDRR